MEDQPEPPAFPFPPEVISQQSSITARSAGVAVVPQVTGCQVRDLHITVNTHLPSAGPVEETSPGASGPQTETVTEKLKSNFSRKFDVIFEGIAKRGNPTLLRHIYTELYITEGELGGLNTEHEVWQIDTAFKMPSEEYTPVCCSDIFKPMNIRNHQREAREEKNKGRSDEDEERAPRNVVTKGIAGIGKTVSVQKFILDWAEGKVNQDIDLLLVLPFRELNSVKEKKLSLHELLLDFHSELKETDSKFYNQLKVLFIFDGLDESQLPLDFRRGVVTDVSKPASLDQLMTNLIVGNLLPSASVWITSRPAAVGKIPPHLIHRMTEVRGFSDSQKEQYFRKRIRDQSLARRIISHVKDSRTLEIMCHIPVFCWITATVLEQMLKAGQEQIPSSLTELYTRFLLLQTSEKKKKYLGIQENDPLKVSDEDVQLILKLGKLAFDGLKKHNMVFSEEDLKKYEVDVAEASLRSGVFTEVLREEDPMFSEKMYSFVHLSFQEYLAAFFVLHTFADKGENAMKSNKTKGKFGDDQFDENEDHCLDFSESEDEYLQVPQQKMTLYHLQKYAIDKALKTFCGHLDLFLRFLLGLSLGSNQKLLRSFSVNVEHGKISIQQTVRYLKSKLREEDNSWTLLAEQCINLFQCLLELNDHSIAEEIRSFLTPDKQAEKKLTAAQCSTLAYIILMSGETLKELDLTKYNTSTEGRRRLVPAVRNCRRAVLSNCTLNKECCETLAAVLQNPKAHLRDLDLSQNDLDDPSLLSLRAGLNSPHCSLEALDLSHINLKTTGAALLEALLMGPHIQPQALKLFSCSLRDDCAEVLRSALWSTECRLRELDLSYNHLTPAGIAVVLQGLLSPSCDLQILRLSGIPIGPDGCRHLASALEHSLLRELTLNGSNIGNEGAVYICRGLTSPHCQLQILGLKESELSTKACFYLSVVLSSYSVLRELDLGDNDLKDSGVKLLSTGLKNPNCVLHKLGLSGCMITEEGCSSLASALNSNLSNLRELDLSYNHPGNSGEQLLCANVEDLHCRLEKLKLDHGGHPRITAGLWKYFQELSVSKVKGILICSPDRKGVSRHLPRLNGIVWNFVNTDTEWASAYCGDGLAGGRFYWEVEWTGLVNLTITYNEDSQPLGLAFNDLPYLISRIDRYQTTVPAVPQISTQRIGILLDWPAGTLSYYSISPQGASHLYTFHTTFEKPVYPGFHLAPPNWRSRPASVIIATRCPDSVLHTRKYLFEKMGQL